MVNIAAIGVGNRASNKYQNPCPNGDINNCQPKNIHIPSTACNKARDINTELIHLPSCQMIRYKPVPLPEPTVLDSCPSPQLRQ